MGAHAAPTEQATKGPAWFSAIQGFYFEAAQAFLINWQRERDSCDQADQLYGESPKLWKTVGDEVLFVKHITDHRQIAVTLHCWMSAVRRMRDFLKNENSSLDVKCTAWTAGFPFRNREVVLDTNVDKNKSSIEDYYKESGLLLNNFYNSSESSSLAIDYIGPSIDTGFRLSGFSSSRKMIVSVDVAYIISMTHFDGDVKRLDFFYDGAAALKGVFGGSNYPIFWVDMSEENSLARKEDKLRTQTPCVKEDVKEYCEKFYEEHRDFTFRPFVFNDVGQTMAKKPLWYDEYHKMLIDNFLRPDTDYNADDIPSSDDDTEADQGMVDEIAEQLKKRASDDSQNPV